ncbi:TetR/AcrR family transcriptional regulator [Nesterenkonia ebinurensis]|uniref:TetR/AcrR family transcriptional regulator n=1 Tax=Nesterenkonia ebinurensis TaxID=2608252 RepID=UPI00123DDE5C|nr:TetR/AcrR family transcriptional regulator [Nesterenkonia ebinurensis]
MPQDVGTSTKSEGPFSRRRGEELRQAIFAAVFDQLRTTGYARLTMEGVAAAAGTGKSALYRRWPDRDALVREALAEALPDPSATTLTGETRSDLLALLSLLQEVFNRSSGTVFQVLASEVGTDTDFMRSLVHHHVVEPCTERIGEVLHAATPPAATPSREMQLLAQVGPAMLTHHCLSGNTTIPDDYLAEVVDLLLMHLRRA